VFWRSGGCCWSDGLHNAQIYLVKTLKVGQIEQFSGQFGQEVPQPGRNTRVTHTEHKGWSSKIHHLNSISQRFGQQRLNGLGQRMALI